VTKTLIAR